MSTSIGDFLRELEVVERSQPRGVFLADVITARDDGSIDLEHAGMVWTFTNASRADDIVSALRQRGTDVLDARPADVNFFPVEGGAWITWPILHYDLGTLESSFESFGDSLAYSRISREGDTAVIELTDGHTRGRWEQDLREELSLGLPVDLMEAFRTRSPQMTFSAEVN